MRYSEKLNPRPTMTGNRNFWRMASREELCERPWKKLRRPSLILLHHSPPSEVKPSWYRWVHLPISSVACSFQREEQERMFRSWRNLVRGVKVKPEVIRSKELRNRDS